MARRLFNGRAFSEDGWPYVDEGSCQWITVPGTNVSLGIQAGIPAIIMGAFAADINAYVEPLRDPDSACWTAGNSVATSNHPGGTAMDLNWNSHAFQVRGTFNAAQQATIDELLDWWEGMIFWGGRWESPVDEMHWQMGYDTYDIASDRPYPKCQDFINRKIRADGFSRFRRGDAPLPPPPLSLKDQHALDIIHEGQRRGITERGIKIALATALVESNITIYANERVPASMAIPHEAVGSDAYSVGIFQQQVRDTGNGWWWSDAATCMDPTLSAGLFYERLAKLNYNGPSSPGSYAQTVQDSAFPDRYDERYVEAQQLYDRLINATPIPSPPPPIPGDDELSAEAERQIAELHEAFFGPPDFDSLSPLRRPGEGKVGNLLEFIRWMDGNIHIIVELLLVKLRYPDPDAITLLQQVAINTEPGRERDRKLASAILAEVDPARTPVSQPAPSPASQPTSAPAPVDNSHELTVAHTQIDHLQAENNRLRARLQAVTHTPAPAPPETTGDKIGAAYDALEELRLADALPIEHRAPLGALIAVLQTKTGNNSGGTQ